MQGKRKIALVALAVALALFLAGSLARCAAKAADPGQAPEQEQAQGEARGPEEGEPKPADPPAETRRYDQKEQELLGYLASSKWADSTGTVTAEFSEDAVVERSAAGGERRTPFSLESVEAKPNMTMAVVEAAGEHVALTLVLPVEGDATVSSQAFSLASEYRRLGNVGCTVEGIDGEAASLVDGEKDALAKAVAAFCETSLPTSTTATFAGSARVDTKAGTVTLLFEPDAAEGVAVQAVYDRASHTFTCSMAPGASL